MRRLTFLLALAASTPFLQVNALEFAPCALKGSNGNGHLQAECATWEQPLNRAEPDGETIELFVARLKSTALEPANDAFTVINGGPGGSSVDLLVDFGAAFRAFTRERDVLVIDQRGTGRSSPLTCDAVADEPTEPDEEEIKRLTLECIEKLPRDPRYFTTTVAVQDLDALRAELGYDQLSVYGVSYGTRVTQQYMRMYPDQTRVAIIDGVVPPSEVLGHQVALHSQDSLNDVFDRCAEDPKCQERFPDLEADFATLAELLKANEIPLKLQHPITGVPTELNLAYGHLLVYVRFALYAPETTALIPLIIHQAVHEKNYLPVAANALRMLHNVTSAINYGMHNAVICTEDTPFFAEEQVDFAALDSTYIGRDMYDTLGLMCGSWPAGVIDPDMKVPLESDVPTLVLSGEYDPITPPAWGDAVLRGLTNAKHLVAPGQGHGTIARGCIPKLALEFVESANVSEVDVSCLEHLAPYPFFVDLMGPPP